MAGQKKGKARDAGRGGGLTGGGPSIVGVSGAMRARDASRIRPQDQAAAEKNVVIRRRPPEPDAATDEPRTR